jgi:hypothetical protein
MNSRSSVQKNPRHLGLQSKWAALSRNVNSALALQHLPKISSIASPAQPAVLCTAK